MAQSIPSNGKQGPQPRLLYLVRRRWNKEFPNQEQQQQQQQQQSRVKKYIFTKPALQEILKSFL